MYFLGYPPRADIDYALDLAEHLESKESQEAFTSEIKTLLIISKQRSGSKHPCPILFEVPWIRQNNQLSWTGTNIRYVQETVF